ncbi:ATP synthase subunit delta [Rosistilla oblonga]|uniref:ATP synthase subunit delta n=1 Tax=Rosistilla ulvae TaxID=1930277 RepID=A0A517M4Q4_9BACT|nr:MULTISPECIES: F0F1 ATP synthase subunit delta [Rosistilla]QDS89854.1 ATP synthase subunit delta [Rosistilla ulvae]QDV13859.1 ATP synthase subunit delta [Rosistilla oblonga]
MNESAKHDTVLDTGALQLGRVYAQALIGAAMKEGVTDDAIEQLGQLVDDVLSQHPTLASVFASPRVSQEEKSRILDSLLGDKVHPVLLRFLKVVAGRGRLGYLNEIRYSADQLKNEMMGRVVAEVRTALPLTDELRQSVQQRLADKLGKDVVLKETVDPQLIGGLVVRIGDTVIDSSVAGQLESLSQRARDGLASKLIANADSFANGS